MHDEEDEAPKGPAPARYEHDPEAPGLLRWRQMPPEARWSAVVGALLAGRNPVQLGRDAFRFNARSRVCLAVIPAPAGSKRGTVAVRAVTEGDDLRARMLPGAPYDAVERMVRN